MSRRRALLAALVCTVVGFSWQLLTVHFNYGGNLTALFCHGSKYPAPASLAAEHIYVFPNSGGYDGQSYHYVAHDPLCRTDICRAVPDPSRRYPRILVPGMAHLLALGRTEWVDRVFVATNLIFLFLGAWWLAQLCGRPILAAFYVLVPASIISLDRMLIDLALVSLCLGFAVCLREERWWKLWLIFAAAALCRETGFLLFAAYGVRLAMDRRWLRILTVATALVPAVIWNLRTGAGGFGSPIPLAGVIDAIWHPRPYAFPPLAVIALRSLDWMQLVGLLLAMAFGLAAARRVTKDPLAALCFLWACFAIAIPAGTYDDPFGGARILSPLLLFEFLSGERWRWLPMAMVLPRVLVELGPQLPGILHAFS